jgi:hypothetical protein
MGNTTSNTKQTSASEYFQSTMLNNIAIFTTMAIIYIFISADRGESYTSMDQFMFMSLITNPHPCDIKHTAQKDSTDEKKTKANSNGTTKTNGTTNPLLDTGGNPLNSIKGLTGGSVTEGLVNVASTLNNVGQAINTFTADVKQDLDNASYKTETLSRHKETYCNDMDDMSMFGAFFFIMHSGFLASYNAIQMVNSTIVKIIHFKSEFMSFDLGILLLYGLFFLMSTATTSFIGYITVLIDPSKSLTDSFTRKLVLSIFSALISLFSVYFLVATIAYITYLVYGMVNIKSEQSAITFKVIFGVFLFINVMITIPSIFGVNLV